MIRADYIHSNLYASLGLAALDRSPVAFLADCDRPGIDERPLVRHLPPALKLAQVSAAIVGLKTR